MPFRTFVRDNAKNPDWYAENIIDYGKSLGVEIKPWSSCTQTVTYRGIYGIYVDGELVYISKANSKLQNELELILENIECGQDSLYIYLRMCRDILKKKISFRQLCALGEDDERGDFILAALLVAYKPLLNTGA